MKKTRKFLLDEERKNQKLTEEKHEQQKEINTLEEKNLELTKTTRSQNTQQILKLENQISYYKSLQESGAAKIENAEIILKLNETQHNTILNLEKKIEDLKEQNKTNITQLKIEHERHYLKLKKNMLDVIKKGQAASSKKNADDLELNTILKDAMKLVMDVTAILLGIGLCITLTLKDKKIRNKYNSQDTKL